MPVSGKENYDRQARKSHNQRRRRSPPLSSESSRMGTSLDGDNNSGGGFYSAAAINAREQIHRHFQEEEAFMQSMRQELAELRKDQQRQRRRMKTQRKLQRAEDKRFHRRRMHALKQEFSDRHKLMMEEREYRTLEKEVGSVKAAEVWKKRRRKAREHKKQQEREQQREQRRNEQKRNVKSVGDDDNDEDKEIKVSDNEEEDEDEDSSSDSSVDSDAEREQEERDRRAMALAKAHHGEFVGDIKIMCASQLPKVDGFLGGGSIDPYVRLLINDEEFMRTEHKVRSQRPRFDHHVKIDFSDDRFPEDAIFRFEIWDYDMVGGDDFISFCEMNSVDIREKCCITERIPSRLPLQANERLKSKLAQKWGVGFLTLQFDCAENIDYEAERLHSKKMSTNLQEKRAQRLARAREDFAIR